VFSGALSLRGRLRFTRWLESAPRQDRELDFVFLCGSATTEWSHPLFHYLFAHRPSQLSCALVFAIFTVLIRLEAPSARELAVLGLLLGLLPATQSQVFTLTVAFVVLFFALSPALVSKRLIVAFFTFSGVAAIQLIQFLPTETYRPELAKGPVWRPLVARGLYFAPIRYWTDALG
jgi:hypothetical protein